MEIIRPDVGAILAGLKDFQRDTVEHIYNRMYTDEHPTRRFLVADEVGLGKTLVARGLIAKVVDHLWDNIDRIDIVYICSNAEIARQNINRLSILGQNSFTLPSRITLLPTTLHNLKHNKINFISFTPDTSFDLKMRTGQIEERVLLYWLLDRAWHIRGTKGPLNVLQVGADKDRFRNKVESFRWNQQIDSDLAAEFVHTLDRRIVLDHSSGHLDIRQRFDNLCQRFARNRKHLPNQDRWDRNSLIGDLRLLLAETCLTALQPDLIILDEFQRFKHLLAGDDTPAELARDLFNFANETSQARVVLLSATPYKMYTLEHEASDNHYKDFVETLRFLRPEGAKRFEQLLEEYRLGIYHLGQGKTSDLIRSKQKIERQLREVMVRTEKLAATEDRDGMLQDVQSKHLTLEANDVTAYLGLQQIARLLKQPDTIEYWKSAPYLLNFMDDYEIKGAFRNALNVPELQEEVAKLIDANSCALLPWSDIAAYRQIDPANARLRDLLNGTIGAGAWRLLWVPPSLPYYRASGVFADASTSHFTKRLVFSSWRVVPKVVAILLSYEAERLMISSFEEAPENSSEARERRRPLLRFAQSEGRLTGMPILGVLYPSITLASVCDPLALSLALLAEQNGGLPKKEEILAKAQARINQVLQPILSLGDESGAEDEAWYWAAPILLDLSREERSTREWFSTHNLATAWAEGTDTNDDADDASGWSAHIEQARELVAGRWRLGRPPSDLAEVLSHLGVAGPGNVALRSLSRVARLEVSAVELRTYAARVAWAFRTLFNLPESTALIRDPNSSEPYWQRVLDYCVDGNLQSSLDEYCHVLRESLGLLSQPSSEVASKITEAIRSALMLRTSSQGVHDITVSLEDRSTLLQSRNMRTRFALAFGEARVDERSDMTRTGQIREAFNSPFWPFVLVTTSVGQEGLDFHTYCHAVVHWNLPSNPVDLEQREGRVHRYKGHAIRKNLAKHYGVRAIGDAGRDPWETLFDSGKRDRRGNSDLVPYWIYQIEGGAKIERHVPALPLSRDLGRFLALRRSLAVYRMVFGQAHQEDLVSFLLTNLAPKQLKQFAQRLKIDLEPPHGSFGK